MSPSATHFSRSIAAPAAWCPHSRRRRRWVTARLRLNRYRLSDDAARLLRLWRATRARLDHRGPILTYQFMAATALTLRTLLDTSNVRTRRAVTGKWDCEWEDRPLHGESRSVRPCNFDPPRDRLVGRSADRASSTCNTVVVGGVLFQWSYQFTVHGE